MLEIRVPFPPHGAGEILELLCFALEYSEDAPRLWNQLERGEVAFSWEWAGKLYELAEEIYLATGREPSPGRRPWRDDDPF